MKGKHVQDDHLMRQEDVVSLLIDDTQISHKLKEISMQAKDRLKKRRTKGIKVDKEGDLMLEDLDDQTSGAAEHDNTSSKKKKSSQKKLPKLQDNGSVDKNAEAEGGEVEDEDSIAAPRPKRSKRLMKNLNEDKEPEQEPTTDGDNPAEAAENNISPDDNDTEEAKDRTPSA
jgi:DNA helicase INO80